MRREEQLGRERKTREVGTNGKRWGEAHQTSPIALSTGAVQAVSAPSHAARDASCHPSRAYFHSSQRNSPADVSSYDSHPSTPSDPHYRSTFSATGIQTAGNPVAKSATSARASCVRTPNAPYAFSMPASPDHTSLPSRTAGIGPSAVVPRRGSVSGSVFPTLLCSARRSCSSETRRRIRRRGCGSVRAVSPTRRCCLRGAGRQTVG